MAAARGDALFQASVQGRVFKSPAAIADTRFVGSSRLGPLLAALLAVVTVADTVGYEFVYDDHVAV